MPYGFDSYGSGAPTSPYNAGYGPSLLPDTPAADFLASQRDQARQAAQATPWQGLSWVDTAKTMLGTTGITPTLQKVGDVAAVPKQMFRAGVGLDPTGSAATDLQNLGMGRVPSAWIGSFADTLGDPTAAIAGPLLKALGGASRLPAVQNFIASERGSLPLGQTAAESSGAASRLEQLADAARTSTPVARTTPATPLPSFEGIPRAIDLPGAGGGANRLGRVIGDTKLSMALQAPDYNDGTINSLVTNLRKNADYGQIMQEVDAGARYLGNGAQAIAFRNPPQGPYDRFADWAKWPGANDVTRVGVSPSYRGATAPPARLDIPEILQPTRDVAFQSARAERLPFVKIGQMGNPADEQAAINLYDQIQKRGYTASDLVGRPDNMGYLQGGQPVLVDPGFVTPNKASEMTGLSNLTALQRAIIRRGLDPGAFGSGNARAVEAFRQANPTANPRFVPGQ